MPKSSTFNKCLEQEMCESNVSLLYKQDKVTFCLPSLFLASFTTKIWPMSHWENYPQSPSKCHTSHLPTCLSRPSIVYFLQWSPSACSNDDITSVPRINKYPWGRKSPEISAHLERALSSLEFQIIQSLMLPRFSNVFESMVFVC